MAYQRYLAQMTLRHIEYGDSFPERHVADLDDLKLVSDEDYGGGSGSGYGGSSAASDSTTVSSRSCRAPSRPPRAPSESPDGYEMRGRYWEAADVLKFDLEESKKAPDVWDFVYDPVCLPPPSGSAGGGGGGASPMRTPAIRQLGAMPIRRAWRRRSSRERPNVRREPVVEAIMMYERGEVLDRVGRCSRCSEGKGISRECVVVSPRLSSGNGVDACSNCLYDGLGDDCDALQRCSYRRSSRKRSRSDAKDKDKGKGEEGGNNSGPRREDYITVLKLIEQVKNSTSAATAAGAGAESKRDQSVVAKAKRIEEAALQVARAAREWGRREREAPSRSKQ
ncbi:hypothetical protein SLS62_000033 [Diatrype stigma]|uniref:Uncharacterized protein n=1 Tax=Diatrype stigma TaxID=117547 RepID=A0AAN9YUN9_9PEZI